MKKIIKHQCMPFSSIKTSGNKSFYSILVPDYKKAFYKILFLTGILFLGLFYQSFGKVPLAKRIERTGATAATKMHKKEVREERRMIRQVEDISSTTMDLFAQEYPDAQQVSWTSTAGFAEVDFTYHGFKRIAFYDYDNSLVGTGKYVSFKDLPAKSFEQIDKHYKDYAPEQVIYYDDNELNENDATVFGTTLDKDSYYTLMKNKNSAKEIVLQITPDGDVLFFSNLK